MTLKLRKTAKIMIRESIFKSYHQVLINRKRNFN